MGETITLLSKREIDKMRRAGALSSAIIRLSCADGKTRREYPKRSTMKQRNGQKPMALSVLHWDIRVFPNPFAPASMKSFVTASPMPNKFFVTVTIINIDVTPILDGYYGDSSRTFCVGTPSPSVLKLVEVTKECLYRGIAAVKPGAKVGDIGAAIQEYAEAEGFSVVRDFVGHGINNVFHTAPQIPHYGTKGKGKRLRSGMTFTIEPMINEGTWEAVVLDDGLDGDY